MSIRQPPAVFEVEYCRSCGKLWTGNDKCCDEQDRVPMRYLRALSDRELEGYLGGAWKARTSLRHTETRR